MAAMDFKNFKKIKEDDKTATLKHSAGHTFTVAKKALGPKLREKLKNIPLHAAGGSGPIADPTEGLEDDTPNASDAAAMPVKADTQAPVVVNVHNGPQQPQANPNMDRLRQLYTDEVQARGGSPAEMFGPNGEMPAHIDPWALESAQAQLKKKQADDTSQQKTFLLNQRRLQNQNAALGFGAPAAEETAPDQTPAQPVPASTPDGLDPSQAYMNAQGTGVLGQMQANTDEAAALGKLGKAQAFQYNQAAQQQQQFQQHTLQLQQQLQNEYDARMADIDAQHIDPDQWIGNKNTAEKVSTAIGLLLGGLGGGLAGHGNPAMDFIQSQIRNNIDAQKANLGKSKSLLDADMAQFGNVNAAGQMAQMTANGILMNKIKAQAAQSQNPLAQIRAERENSLLLQQNAQIAAGLAATTAAQQAGGPRNPNGGLPAFLDPALDRRVEIGSSVFHAPDKETADKVRPQLQALNEIKNVAARIDEFNKTQGTVFNPKGQSAGLAAGLNKEMQAAIAKAEASGGQISRIIDKVKEMSPEAGKFFQSYQSGKSQNLKNFIAAQTASLVQSNLNPGFALPTRKGNQ